jgi:hypothetical protein
MKKLILILAMVLLNFCNIYSQPHMSDTMLLPSGQGCLPEGITFSTQDQIDNFQVNYPGCTEIEGFVIIQGNDISNLDGLSVLTAVGGFL